MITFIALVLFLFFAVGVLVLMQEQPWRAPEWGRDPETGEWRD